MTKKSDLLADSAAFDTFVAAPVSDRGRAIAALTGEQPPAAAPPTTPTVPIGVIAHNPYNPRLTLSAVQSMADSIEQVGNGLITPLAVVTRAAFLAAHPEAAAALDTAAQYVVIDGNRRLAGARTAGLDTLPVHIDDDLARDRDELLKTALIADAQHEDLDHLDQARALARLVETHGSQRAVARILGKSQGWISQRIALLNLTSDLQDRLVQGDLTIETARKIAKHAADEQEGALQAELAHRKADPAAVVTPRPEQQAVQKAAHAAPPATPPSSRPTRPAANQASMPVQPSLPDPAPQGDYGVITPAAGTSEPAWTAWLRQASTQEIAAQLTAALPGKRVYELVTSLADHLRDREP